MREWKVMNYYPPRDYVQLNLNNVYDVRKLKLGKFRSWRHLVGAHTLHSVRNKERLMSDIFICLFVCLFGGSE